MFHPDPKKEEDDIGVLSLGEPFEELALKKSIMVKIVVDETDSDRILGLHYLAPNAGEIIQGFSLAIMLKATKADLDRMVAIHPTAAEEFTNLSIKGSNCRTPNDYLKKGGCCG